MYANKKVLFLTTIFLKIAIKLIPSLQYNMMFHRKLAYQSSYQYALIFQLYALQCWKNNFVQDIDWFIDSNNGRSTSFEKRQFMPKKP